MNLPAYPEYRGTTVRWMEGIPIGWEESSAKMHFLIQLGKMLQNDPGSLEDVEINYLKAQHVNWNHVTAFDLPQMWASPSDIETYDVVNGDLLVCEGGEVGRAAILKNLCDPAIIQNALHRVRSTSRGEVKYFSYLLRHIADSGWFAILCNKATIAHLTSEKLGATSIPVPPLYEQQQIAGFLDYKTVQIDALIAKKKQLIEMLKEQRISIITKAVTKGLDSAAPMRESGITWLGQLPEHWGLTKLRSFCSSIRDGTHDPPPRNIGHHRLLSVRNVIKGKFVCREDDRTMTPEDFAELQRSYTVQEGDVVLAIVGATTGKSAVVGKLVDVTVQRSLAILRTWPEKIHSTFLNYVLQSDLIQTEIKLTLDKYSAQPGIYLDDVGRLPLVQPPLDEQREIIEYLNAQTETIDRMTVKTEAAIKLLTEYRTALITAATTGKIDVRNLKLSN